MINKFIDNRPWGKEEHFIQNEKATVKLLYVKAREKLSLQFHHKRSEFWKIIAGSPIIVIEDQEITAQVGDEFDIPVGAKHRIMGGEDEAIILEIAEGDFDENDITRLDDAYGRT